MQMANCLLNVFLNHKKDTLVRKNGTIFTNVVLMGYHKSEITVKVYLACTIFSALWIICYLA